MSWYFNTETPKAKIVWMCKCKPYPSLNSNKLKVLIHSTSSVTIPFWFLQRQTTYILNTPIFLFFFFFFVITLFYLLSTLKRSCTFTWLWGHFFIATFKGLPSFLWYSAILFSLKYFEYLSISVRAKILVAFSHVEFNQFIITYPPSRYQYPFRWLIFLVL